jgi:hypothetical protein
MLCSVGFDLKKFAAANYFHDLQTDGILSRSDLLTVTNLAHYDHAIPFYFYQRPGLHVSGDGYAETRFRRAVDGAGNRCHDGNNYRLVGPKTHFNSTICHLSQNRPMGRVTLMLDEAAFRVSWSPCV